MFCSSYPLDIIIINGLKDDKNNKKFDEDIFFNARNARCRSRFIVPTIYYRNKHVCRSATISIASETLMNTTYQKTKDIFSSIVSNGLNFLHQEEDSNVQEQEEIVLRKKMYKSKKKKMHKKKKMKPFKILLPLLNLY